MKSLYATVGSASHLLPLRALGTIVHPVLGTAPLVETSGKLGKPWEW